VFLKLQPLVYSLIFLIGLELIILFHRHVFIIVLFLFLVSIYQGKKVSGKWRFSILPVFFTLSSVALLYLVTLLIEQQIFVVLTSSMYYFSLLGAYRLNKYQGDKTALGLNMAATVSTIFFTYAGAYGLYLNFLVPLYALMLVYLIATLMVSYQHFSIIKPVLSGEGKNRRKTIWAYSFLLSLAMTELIWTMNFWPFGYLTTGVIALILYYVLWDMVQSHFLNLLSKKRVVANVIFFSAVICLVLLSSKWIPVI